MKTNITLFTAMLCLFATSLVGNPAPADVDSLIKPYFIIQEGLAKDNLEAAKSGAEKFLTVLEQKKGDDELFVKIESSASQIKSSKDIDSARKSLLVLSSTMQSLIKKSGSAIKTNVYVAFCPMAFGGKGGAWLQKDKTINNPYWGARMLRCGMVKATLAQSKDDHGHSH